MPTEGQILTSLKDSLEILWKFKRSTSKQTNTANMSVSYIRISNFCFASLCNSLVTCILADFSDERLRVWDFKALAVLGVFLGSGSGWVSYLVK